MNLDFAVRLMNHFTYEGQAEALEMFADDGVFEDFTFDFRVEGKEELTKLFERFFDPTKTAYKFTAHNYVGDETGGAIEYTSEMQVKNEDGETEQAKLRGAAVITLRDGKITRFSDYWDQAGLLRKLGRIK